MQQRQAFIDQLINQRKEAKKMQNIGKVD